jgi:dolichyl-phosphate-mannose-protein mannosyltransferase
MLLLQNIIHFLEVGGGLKLFSRFSRVFFGVLGVLLLAVGYNLCGFKNMATEEAMDSAQLARNIAQGKGYNTLFVRPLSIYLLKRENETKKNLNDPAQSGNLAEVKGMHPDLANPPVYPVVLAGLMKVLPFRFPIDTTHAFWSRARTRTQREFLRYQPDFLIAVFNQCLFVGVVVLTFFWARRMFDSGVAWLSSMLLLGSELFWRFAVSGLSTMLLLLLFMALVWSLTLLEKESREPKWGRAGALVLAAFCGLMVGAGSLTRYSFAWLILPVIVFLIVFAGRQRALLVFITFCAFAAVLTPWLVRNYSLCGLPFGTASYAVLENTVAFPEHRLERSLDPDFGRVNVISLVKRKLVTNSRSILQNDLPRLAGTWVSGFFLVGLLVGFKNPAVRRLRYFLVASLLLLIVVQALGRTALSEDSPDINSENLLVLLAPLVTVYGTGLFFLLLEQVALPSLQIRYVAIGLFGTVLSLPLLLVLMPPRNSPLAYPPYYPPAVQQISGWTRPEELMMSDIPWAVAWYGQAQCVWLTLNCQSAFLAINDFEKPIQALYLSRISLDGRFLSQWVRTGEKSWGEFILNCLFRKAQGKPGPPPDFPLQYWQPGWPDQFLLTFREHWPRSS